MQEAVGVNIFLSALPFYFILTVNQLMGSGRQSSGKGSEDTPEQRSWGEVLGNAVDEPERKLQEEEEEEEL